MSPPPASTAPDTIPTPSIVPAPSGIPAPEADALESPAQLPNGKASTLKNNAALTYEELKEALDFERFVLVNTPSLYTEISTELMQRKEMFALLKNDPRFAKLERTQVEQFAKQLAAEIEQLQQELKAEDASGDQVLREYYAGAAAEKAQRRFDSSAFGPGKLSALLEPLMMVFLGGSVGGLLIAMYLPIFKIAETIG